MDPRCSGVAGGSTLHWSIALAHEGVEVVTVVRISIINST